MHTHMTLDDSLTEWKILFPTWKIFLWHINDRNFKKYYALLTRHSKGHVLVKTQSLYVV